MLKYINSNFLRSAQRILRFAYQFIVVTSDSLFLYFPKSRQYSTLLLVRVDRIGDFVLWLDTAQSYRKIYPGHHIVLIANSIVSDLAREFDCWDEVWPVNTLKFRQNLLYRWSIMFRVHQAGFETAIQPTFSRELRCGDSLIRASRALHRIGSSGDLTLMSSLEKKLANRWYTQLIHATNLNLMEYDRNIEFLQGLGYNFSNSVNSILVSINKIVSHFKLPTNYFIVFPGASDFVRSWDASRYADVARYIHQNFRLSMVICGTSNESHLADQIIASAGINAIDLTGKTSLPELIQVIKSAHLLIGNDTSGVHIAAAVQTASVCILGGPISGRFMPYSSNYPWVKPIPVYSKTSLNSVSVRMVQENLADLLPKI